MLRSAGECWAITDDAAGNQRQALALAERLAMPVRHLVLEPRAPWSWFAPRLLSGGRLALPAAQRELFAPPWPVAAIGCGRAAALFTRMLRGLSDGDCFTVQILDPRIDPGEWDLVIAPRHDELTGPNVLHPVGSLNPIDDAWLDDAREAFPALGELPGPRLGVLLGGPRRGVPMDAGYAHALGDEVRRQVTGNGGSAMVVASRRTPSSLSDAVGHAVRDLPGLFWRGPSDGPNPYPGVLGWADRLLVTPDSVNMLSEACAVGCPVETLAPARLPPRIASFHRALRDGGWLGDGGPAAGPLRETATLAARVGQAIRARHPGIDAA
ncbi:mitochondrial fission ELM1 family protein [Dyella lutea]|uniref:Mitochondrial fission ELM1 family protein n=1 Tax=Dyella lutea TaxID=2950441 RepID=A0ABT1F726_9GAMM|nr:mitochondrial fission ELM1 family protein [Dyella lutea]MCP1373186.1 mitochondrial fission ELM1 family protein [Dyella lutea]